MASMLFAAIFIVILSSLYAAPDIRDSTFCSQQKPNCAKSPYLKQVCAATCSGVAPAEVVCTTGAKAADTTCSISSNCPANYYCYSGGCCPLPTCNDGVTKSSQLCDNIRNFCPTGFECQNGGCCPRRATGSAGRGQGQSAQAVPAVISPGGNSGSGGSGAKTQPGADPRKPKNDANGITSTGLLSLLICLVLLF